MWLKIWWIKFENQNKNIYVHERVPIKETKIINN